MLFYVYILRSCLYLLVCKILLSIVLFICLGIIICLQLVTITSRIGSCSLDFPYLQVSLGEFPFFGRLKCLFILTIFGYRKVAFLFSFSSPVLCWTRLYMQKYHFLQLLNICQVVWDYLVSFALMNFPHGIH